MSLLKTNSRISAYALFFIAVAFVFVKFRQVKSDPAFIPQSYALSWDNYGYYLHLPATIIYHDPGIENKSWLDSLNNKYQPGRPFYQAWQGQNNRLVNVYPVGLAICNLPFFLGGHLVAKISGYPADGLSPPYQWAMILSSLFYGILGLFLLQKLLLKFFSDKLSALLLLLIAMGTNLYYYATYDDILPHIFLFALDTQILLLTIRWHENQKAKTALAIGLLLGLITIVRPSEIVWVLIPLLWNVSGWKTFLEKLKLLRKNSVSVILLVVGMIAVGSLQLFYWKYTSGNWFSFNHTEGFDFFRPFTMKVLFSYKKGWLLYTPLMVLAIVGFFFTPNKQKNLFIPLFVFFLANLWFISSWECWWYAGTFGQRPFVQSYGLMAIPLGFLLSRSFEKIVLKYFVGVVLAFFVLLNQFQTWQVNQSMISLERMTENYYWKIFGKTHLDPQWEKLLEVDRGNVPPLDGVLNQYNRKTVFKLDFENSHTSADTFICDTIGFVPMDSRGESKHSMLMDANHEFALNFHQPFEMLCKKDYFRARYSADVFLPADFISKPTYIIFSMVGSRSHNYGYTGITIDSTMAKPGKWCHIHADYITPEILHEDDSFNVYLWNQGHANVYFDNVQLEIFEEK